MWPAGQSPQRRRPRVRVRAGGVPPKRSATSWSRSRVRVEAAVIAAVPVLDGRRRPARARCARSTRGEPRRRARAARRPGAAASTAGVPPEALGVRDRPLVRRGIDPGDLVHAYLVGQNELWRAWMEELTHSGSTPDRGWSRRSSCPRARLFSRVDFLVAQLMRHVDRERERLDGRRARAPRAARAHAARRATSRTSPRPRARWATTSTAGCSPRSSGTRPSDDPARARRLEAQAASPRARPAPRGRSRSRRARRSLWTWIGDARAAGPRARHGRAARTSLPARQGVALGTRPAQGSRASGSGTRRRSHARRIAELGGRDAASSATTRSRRSRCSAATSTGSARFVAAHARPAHRATTRRPPGCARRCWPGWPRAATRAARPSALHAHKNTVLYRLQRAQQILGRPLDDDRGELELALTAMQRSSGARGPPGPEGDGVRARVTTPRRGFGPRARTSA